jgi:hypothetical protein
LSARAANVEAAIAKTPEPAPAIEPEPEKTIEQVLAPQAEAPAPRAHKPKPFRPRGGWMSRRRW